MYVRPFLLNAGEGSSAVGLKIVHSQRVRHETVSIGRDLDLEGHALFLAELAGLFHDIGRFEQFRQFGTFVDAQSVDHAAVGCKVLKREGVLNDLASEDRSVILDAIYYHNKLAVPESFRDLRLLLSQLVRDADKLDILRVFDEVREKGSGTETVNLGLPECPDISPSVFREFMQGDVVRFKNIRTSADFLVMRLSWLYDINFQPTLKRIIERGYIKRMEQQIPDGRVREQIFHRLKRYLSERMSA